jgi:hypothetical protein
VKRRRLHPDMSSALPGAYTSGPANPEWSRRADTACGMSQGRSAHSERTITVNVLGFAGMVNVAVAHLETRGSGHLVGISELAFPQAAQQASAAVGGQCHDEPPRLRESDGSSKRPVPVLLLFERPARTGARARVARPESRQILARAGRGGVGRMN